jgi:hypothetical protein
MPNYRGLAEEIAAGVLRNGAKLGAESILAHLEAAHEDGRADERKDGLAARFAHDIMMATAVARTMARAYHPTATPEKLETAAEAVIRDVVVALAYDAPSLFEEVRFNRLLRERVRQLCDKRDP